VLALKNKKNNYLTILLVFILLLSVCISSFSSSFRKGFPIPCFTLKTIDGETFNLEDYKEQQKLLILYFYSEENKESIKGVEKLAKYFEEHTTQEKYQIFLVNTRKDLEEKDIISIKEFWYAKKIEFLILLDEHNEVNKLCKIEILPTAIFLDKNLVVKRVYPALISKQQTLMFQYINYFLECKEKETPEKEKKENEGCNGGVCPPPPGY